MTKKEKQKIKDAQGNFWAMAIIWFLLAIAVFDSVVTMLLLIGLVAILLFVKALIDEAISWVVKKMNKGGKRAG